jgi:hypothetical protein
MSIRFLKPINIVALAFLLFVGLELALRLTGLGSFPIYDIDSDFKYIPAANQNGVFMNRNNWTFNDRHMGNAANWSPGKHPDVLLVGNSIVVGGNPYNQKDKLGPLLERTLGGTFSVWSIGAGGWTNVNEMGFLEKNPDIVRNADFVVIEYMEGGLARASQRAGETIFPAHRPVLLSIYLFERYFLPYLKGGAPVNDSGALPPVGSPDPVQLERFKRFVDAATKTSKVLIFLYPGPSALINKERWRQVVAPAVAICESLAIKCVDIAAQKSWTANLYKDGLHPTVEGNKILADILAENIQMQLQKQ